ncbi:MAG: ferric reductase [Proteobacteria bacterium]|nr:ferric reductase [Pseudomonadota bacterium]
MTTVLLPLLTAICAAWALAVANTTYPAASATLWIVRQEAMNLTGLLSIALMSLSMLLATRPAWLEKPLHGLDRIYRLHKWSGILAIAFGAAHWLAKLSSGPIKTLIGRDGRLPKIRYDGLLEVLREFGKDMGEPALYIVLAMLAITLCRRIPYHYWRQLHRIMPALYLLLALHAAMLAPLAYWTEPVGALLAVVLAVGVVASVISLGGLIGRRRQADGSVLSVSQANGITELTCQLGEQWPSHRPGQFAFITFDRSEGAHPFTIASADRGDRTVTFFIKALGDFTNDLAQRVEVGQKVRIEGPYGRFQLARTAPAERQIWIAGGIGVTPFLAWLEALHSAPTRKAELHYCTRDRDADSMVDRLRALCAALPGIALTIHSARHGDVLTAASLKLADGQQAELWFCGPTGLAEALKKSLQASWNGRWRFHQEAFEMR